MTIGIWVLGDQLWEQQAALQSCQADRENASVILIESYRWVRLRPYHRQKLVLVWSAMRHFADALRQAGWAVTYDSAEEFEPCLCRWITTHHITELRVMEPCDRPFTQVLASLSLPCPITLIPNNQFLWSTEDFAQWAQGRKTQVMEYFYREGRKRFNLLMEGDQPIGGVWNLDKDNRKPPKKTLYPPDPLGFEPDAITQTVMAQVQAGEFSTYGAIAPFRWGVTRTQALAVLDDFIHQRLPQFGPYQDAMVTGQATMWHALLSPYLNLGLLQPMEVLQAAQIAYYEHHLPLNSVEGFIRQILGWREYMRGLYTYLGDRYSQSNWFNHTHPLPTFFWDATQTDLNCLHQTLSQVEQLGYAHHIQRLMILSNFALIAGLSPQAVKDWFHGAFIDAYDWVMQTNVIGMGLFADGGILASKPYAASANYVNRMSNYCKGCYYNPAIRVGDRACPFNFFYWDFLARHRDKLQTQGRMTLILKNLDKLSADDLKAMHQQAETWHRKYDTA